MKKAKWVIAVVALVMISGCAKSDEQKLEDAARDAQKDAAKAIEGMKLK